MTALGETSGNLDDVMEKRYIRKDGRETWVQLAVTMLRDAQERPLYFLAEIVDIDELKHSQRDLEQSAALVEDLYNHAPNGYHSLDVRGVIVHINDTELQWLGYERDEVVGKLRFSDIITPASQTTFNAHYPTFKREGALEDLEFEMLRKDGSSFFVLLSASAIFDAQGHYQMSRSTMELADRALALENLLHSEGADGTALEAATRSLGDGLAQVIGGIATYLERTRSWPPVETDLPAGERDARLARLHSALANSDGNAGNHLKSLFGALDETERQHLRSELMSRALRESWR